MKRKRERPRGRLEPVHVSGDVIWLHYILGVFVRGVAPAADFDIHFAVMQPAACVVVGEHFENSSGLQRVQTAYYELVGSIAEISRQAHFRATPVLLRLGDAHVHRTLFVDRDIRCRIDVLAAASARYGSQTPLIAAEFGYGGGWLRCAMHKCGRKN